MDSVKTAIKATYFSILSHAVLALIKGIAGILGNSYALVADAIESTTDIFSSLFILFGLKYAKRPADENHPYGHGKIEPLITFVVVAFLVISATVIAYQSVLNIQTKHEPPRVWTLFILAGIVCWKELSYRFMMRKSRQTHSSSLRAEAWHHRSDALSSVMAFLGISLALILGDGFEYIDDIAALLASGFILFNSYLIFRPALGEIMDEQLHDEVINEIRTQSLKVPGVLGTEKCFIRKSGTHYHVDLHVIVLGSISVTEGHRIAHKLQDHLLKCIPNLTHVLIHIEPNV